MQVINFNNIIMKKNLLIYCLLIISVLFTSCSDEDNLNKSFSDFNFASFDNPNAVLTVQEDSGTFEIDFTISAAQATDTQISIEATDDSGLAGVHYSFVNQTVTVPAGAYSGSFTLVLIDDEESNESRSFNINLTSANPNIIVGLAGNDATFEKRVVIVNDDCPTNYNIWFGPLSVEDVGFGTSPGTGSATPNGTCDLLRVINDLPGIGGNTTSTYDIVLVPFIEGGTSGIATVEATVARTGIANATFGDLEAIYSASGVYDETTQTINLNYQLDARDGTGEIVGSFYTGTNVIIKN